jgi:glycosyltransferase involved in cell wall biosynthesis
LVGIIGNIKPWKGQDVAIRALGLLRDEFPNVTCLLVGDTSPGDVPYRDKIESLIKELGLDGRDIITGYRTDVADYIAALEIQIHASIDPEPFGRVLLEGMALNKPLVASGGGAVPEIVVHGKTGLLFEPGRPDALAAAVRSLLMDPALAASMGRAGRARVASDFSIEHNVHEIQTLYDRLLAN